MAAEKRCRTAQQIPLAELDPQIEQSIVFFLPLDPLSDDFHPQVEGRAKPHTSVAIKPLKNAGAPGASARGSFDKREMSAYNVSDSGGMAERLKAAVLKTADREVRGFESLSLRHTGFQRVYWGSVAILFNIL